MGYLLALTRLMHRTSLKVDSQKSNFRFTEFSEVQQALAALRQLPSFRRAVAFQ
jgi:hypothetical protein